MKICFDPQTIKTSINKFWPKYVPTDPDQPWLEEQERRQETMKRVCDKYGKKASRGIYGSHYYNGEKENLLWCVNYKVRKLHKK